jgi:hypothetical protein
MEMTLLKIGLLLWRIEVEAWAYGTVKNRNNRVVVSIFWMKYFNWGIEIWISKVYFHSCDSSCCKLKGIALMPSNINWNYQPSFEVRNNKSVSYMPCISSSFGKQRQKITGWQLTYLFPVVKLLKDFSLYRDESTIEMSVNVYLSTLDLKSDGYSRKVCGIRGKPVWPNYLTLILGVNSFRYLKALAATLDSDSGLWFWTILK